MSRAPELTTDLFGDEWSVIWGMRNRIAHGYAWIDRDRQSDGRACRGRGGELGVALAWGMSKFHNRRLLRAIPVGVQWRCRRSEIVTTVIDFRFTPQNVAPAILLLHARFDRSMQ